MCALIAPYQHAAAFTTIGSPLQNTLPFSRCTTTTTTTSSSSLSEKRGDFRDDDMFDDDDSDDFYDDRRPRRRRRGPPPRGDERYDSYDDLGGYYESRPNGMNVPSAFGRRDGLRLPESVSKSLLAGIFILGVGLGVTVDSQINTSPKDLASRDAIDQAAPNAELCATMGASAMAFDQRVFVSFNPFNVYVSQADVKPACVLRQSNIVPILKDDKHLLNDQEVRGCKANMNTWAFVGNLNDKPQLSCVYKSEDAQNEFLSNPKLGIGEDYLDDDRTKGEVFTKQVKNGMTTSQKASAASAASAAAASAKSK
ncbi:unnamed protein product [Cylindrotheca closterium]|uniref:DUF3172 domain-containing protein n=1 Tax=Cylindrotheca closterium TaxID=2856 RepID=A0AAD2FW28_9STRA|nr:unnamed protein product [Cylindrotheca closterium]